MTAPADWEVVSNGRPSRRHRAAPAARRWSASRTTPPLSTVRHRAGRRAVPQGDRPPRRHRPRRLLPGLAGRVPRRRRDPRRHQAGLRLVPPGVRLPVPVRQVRPAVRARVQRRRDGERGLRDVPGGLRLPLEGHRRRVRAARRDDPARAGAHVVRRPGHHALVGRPVAERVVRHASSRCSARPQATRWTSAWTTFANIEKTWAYRQDQLPSTHPIAADIPDVHAVEVNFDGITYAKGASVLKQLAAYVGIDAVPARRCGSTSAGTRTATPRWPTCSRALERGVRTRPVRLVGAVAGDGRDQHPARRTSRSTTTAATRRSPSCKAPAEPGGDRCATTGWRSASTQVDGGEARPRRAGRAGRRRRAHRGAGAGRRRPAGPAAGQRRRPDLRARSGWTSARWRPWSQRIADIDDPLAARAVLERGLGHDPRRRDARRATTWRSRWPASRGETEIGVVQSIQARLRGALDRFRRPGAGRRTAGRSWPTLAEAALRGRGPAPTCSWRGRAPSRRPPARRRTSRWCAGCSTGPSRSRAGGRHRAALVVAVRRWSRSAPPATPRSTLELERDATAAGQRRAATARALRPTAEAKAEAWRLATADDRAAQRDASRRSSAASTTRRSTS